MARVLAIITLLIFIALSGLVDFFFYFLFMERSKKTREVHQTAITTHSLAVDGVDLVYELKTATVMCKDTEEILRESFQQERRIGSKSIKLIMDDDGSKFEDSELSDEEKKQFNSDWKKLWRPSVDSQEFVKKMLKHLTFSQIPF